MRNDLERPTDGDHEHLQLERLDGTPADPPSFKTTVLGWNPGDRIHGVVGFSSKWGVHCRTMVGTRPSGRLSRMAVTSPSQAKIAEQPLIGI
jgi:hypothetical protein